MREIPVIPDLIRNLRRAAFDRKKIHTVSISMPRGSCNKFGMTMEENRQAQCQQPAAILRMIESSFKPFQAFSSLFKLSATCSTYASPGILKQVQDDEPRRKVPIKKPSRSDTLHSYLISHISYLFLYGANLHCQLLIAHFQPPRPWDETFRSCQIFPLKIFRSDLK